MVDTVAVRRLGTAISVHARSFPVVPHECGAVSVACSSMQAAYPGRITRASVMACRRRSAGLRGRSADSVAYSRACNGPRGAKSPRYLFSFHIDNAYPHGNCRHATASSIDFPARARS